MRVFFTVIAVVALCLSPRVVRAMDDDDVWFDPAYVEALSLGSGSGLLTVPTAEVMPHNNMVAGMHRYMLKAGYGVWDVFELGALADLEGYTDLANLAQKIAFQGRVRVLREDKHYLSLAAGVESPTLDTAGTYAAAFHPQRSGQPTWYVVANRTVPLFEGMVVDLGWGSNAFSDSLFGGVGVVLFPGMMLTGEYDGVGTNVGARMMLSSQIKLDVGFSHLQSIHYNRAEGEIEETLGQVFERNVFFGVSYTENIQWGLY